MVLDDAWELDWDRPFTDQELRSIDAICQSATASASSSTTDSFPSPPNKTPLLANPSSTDNADESSCRPRRRLPDSLFAFQNQGSSSFSITPCRKNRFSYSPYSSQGNLRMRYQEITFKGHILYSRTAREVENAAEELLTFVETKRQREGQVVLGFDIEWKPTFEQGVAPGKAAVMQICGNNSHCHVIHIIHSGIPQKLQFLLEDPSVVKVGVCIANDAMKVLHDHNVTVNSVEDLSDLANQKLGGPRKKWSLALLTETLVCKQLPKPYKIRLGNWEADVLSKKQQQYAAADAYVSWYLYQVLKSFPEVDDDTRKTEDINAGAPQSSVYPANDNEHDHPTT